MQQSSEVSSKSFASGADSATGGGVKRKTPLEYAEELESLLIPEIERRSAWLSTIPLYREAGLNHSQLTQIACASVRAEVAHAISCETTELINHFGGHPLYYMADHAQRKISWKMDLIDCFDKIKSLDLTHDPAFVLFLVRGDQNSKVILELQPPQLYTMASRGVRQIATPQMKACIEEFGEYFRNRIAIPFCNTWRQRRNADREFNEVSYQVSLPQIIKTRFPSDFEGSFRKLTLSPSSWPTVKPMSSQEIAAAFPMPQREPSSADMGATVTVRGKDKGKSVPTFMANPSTPTTPVKQLSFTPATPVKQLHPPPRQYLGLQARQAAIERGGRHRLPAFEDVPNVTSPPARLHNTVSSSALSDDLDSADEFTLRDLIITKSSPVFEHTSHVEKSASVASYTSEAEAFLYRPQSTAESGTTKSETGINSTQDSRSQSPVTETGSFIMPDVRIGYSAKCSGDLIPSAHASSPSFSLGIVSNDQGLSSMGSFSFEETWELGNQELTHSRINPKDALKIDPLLRKVLRNDPNLSRALLGIDWSLSYGAFTTHEFSAMLTPTMRAWADCADLSLEATAALYAIFEPTISWVTNGAARVRLLSENFAITREFAGFLVNLIDNDQKADRTDLDRNTGLKLSPALHQFIDSRSLTFFASSHLCSLLSNNFSYEERIDRLTDTFAIDKMFAEFLIYLFVHHDE